MVSSHAMMALLVIVGYVAVIVTIVIAVLESRRKDNSE